MLAEEVLIDSFGRTHPDTTLMIGFLQTQILCVTRLQLVIRTHHFEGPRRDSKCQENLIMSVSVEVTDVLTEPLHCHQVKYTSEKIP